MVSAYLTRAAPFHHSHVNNPLQSSKNVVESSNLGTIYDPQCDCMNCFLTIEMLDLDLTRAWRDQGLCPVSRIDACRKRLSECLAGECRALAAIVQSKERCELPSEASRMRNWHWE